MGGSPSKLEISRVSYFLPFRSALGKRRGNVAWLFGATFPLFLLACATIASAQTEPPRIRVGVDLVSVAVRVADKQGQDVQGLSAGDFTILEDGRPQKIAFFAAENQPVSLSILLDASSSMDSSTKLERVRSILAQLTRRGHSDDEISLMEFTDQIGPFQQLKRGQLLGASAAALSPTTGGTALYDAIAVALCHLRAAKFLRQAIVVITDGADQHSRLALAQLIQLLQPSRAQLFMIGFFSAPEYEIYRQHEKTVTLVTGHEIDNPIFAFEQLAKESGAESFFPTSQSGLEQALQAISSILQAQYTVAYYPEKKPKSFRRIEVKVNRRGVKVRTRHGVGVTNGDERAHSAAETCEIRAELHPYPYESRLTRKDKTLVYREDFSDPRTGWPNRAGSQYVAGGYQLSSGVPTGRDGLFLNPGPIGEGVLAAYGPWWEDFRASVLLDAPWAKTRPSVPTSSDPRVSEGHSFATGLVFHMNDRGFYALLLSTAGRAKDLWFTLVKKPFWSAETDIIPWTRISDTEAPETGILQEHVEPPKRISVECTRDQITLFVDDKQVARVRDASFRNGYVGLVMFGNGRVVFRDLRVEGLH